MANSQDKRWMMWNTLHIISRYVIRQLNKVNIGEYPSLKWILTTQEEEWCMMFNVSVNIVTSCCFKNTYKYLLSLSKCFHICSNFTEVIKASKYFPSYFSLIIVLYWFLWTQPDKARARFWQIGGSNHVLEKNTYQAAKA